MSGATYTLTYLGQVYPVTNIEYVPEQDTNPTQPGSELNFDSVNAIPIGSGSPQDVEFLFAEYKNGVEVGSASGAGLDGFYYNEATATPSSCQISLFKENSTLSRPASLPTRVSLLRTAYRRSRT